MHSFATTKDGFKEVRNQTLVPLIFIYVAISIGLIYFLSSDSSGPDDHMRLMLTMAFVIPLLAISAVGAVRRQKKLFESFRLIITEHSISREQSNTPTITLLKDQVREIRKFSNGTICIIGDSKLNVIGIPKQIEHPEELERLLSEIKPFTLKNYGMARVYLYTFLAILFLGLLGTGMVSENPILASASAIAGCAILVVSFIVIQRSKNADKRTKRVGYVTLIPLIAILTYLIMGWMNGV